jgi:sulfur carrier protein ThiS adenylyltransferase
MGPVTAARATEPVERDVRQRNLVPPERLATCHALVVGVGAIGRQVALQLAAVGVPRMTLFDDDTVGTENLAPQGYWADHVGMLKVTATSHTCRLLHPAIEVSGVPERFRRSTARKFVSERHLIVFACVDSIGTRRLLWESLRHSAALFVDGRMSAEVLRVLAAAHPATDTYYATTLFDESQAYVGACTARSTIYTASIAAGIMVGQWARWLRGQPVDADLCFNLLASELTAAGSPSA